MNSGGGGFGGGAGALSFVGPGFGGGSASNTQGGGGFAAGGAIFLRSGTSMTLTDPDLTGLYTVTGGTGSGNGAGIGAGIFLGGNLTINVSGANVNDVSTTDFFGGGTGTAEVQGSLTKSGTGLLKIDGSNSYTGGTTINSGILIVNDALVSNLSALGSGPVSVLSGAYLAGGNSTGSLGSVAGSVTVAAGGAIEPGIFGNPGILTLKGGTALAANAALFIIVSNSTLGSGYSQIKALGTIDLGGCTLILTGTYSPVAGDAFTIISNQGSFPIQNTFKGLNEGAIQPKVFGTNFGAKVSYLGGAGHDVTVMIVPPSNNANLSGLTISAGTLNPTFASGTPNYTDSVPIGTSSCSITPTTADPGATLSINGVPAPSGTPTSIGLSPGTNPISIQVTAADGVTTQAYTLTVTVGTPVDVNLSALSITAGTLSPSFDPATLSYTDAAPSGTSSVSVMLTTEDPNATATVNGTPTPNGFLSSPIQVSSAESSQVNIVVTGSDGATTQMYTIIVTVANAPPVVPPLNSDNNPALINTLVSYTFTATDIDDPVLSYIFDFGDGSSVLSGTFNQGDPVTVTHTYTAYTDNVGLQVSLQVSDETNPPVIVTTQQFVPMPSSTGANVVNVALNAPPVVDPLDSLGVSVAASDGGVIQLAVDINSLTRAAYSASTDWGDTVGRSSTVTGVSPVHQFLNRGIFVAKTTATNIATQAQAGKARLTLALSSKETGDTGGTQTHAHNAGIEPRDLPNNNPAITTKSIKGKFDFSGKKPDTVTFQGTIALPAGVTMSSPYEFWIAIGNIVVKSTIVKGKGTAFSVAGVIKSLKITSKVKKGVTTVGGEPATIAVTYSSKNTVSNGFDTEGISNQSTDVTPGKGTAPRKIQVAMLLEGAPFQSVTPVNFSLTKNMDFGGMSGRSGN